MGVCQPPGCWHVPCSLPGVTHDSDANEPHDFVPVLYWRGHRPSVDEIRTWFEALTGAVATILPNDLLAGWILPHDGDPVLLGPTELSADHLQLPQATPLIRQQSLFALEDRVRRAGFRSVMAVPVREGAEDVGILVIASFADDRYDRQTLRTLHHLADLIAPTCGRLARRPWLVPIPITEDPDRLTCAVVTGMLEAIDRGRTMADLVQLTSDVLGAQLPHDRIEVIAARPATGGWSLLSLVDGPGLADPGVVAARRIEALTQHLGGRIATRVESLEAEGLAWPAPPTVRGGAVNSMVAARLEVAGEFLGWLCFGGERAGWFRPDEEEVAILAARLVAPRVAAWLARAQAEGQR